MNRTEYIKEVTMRINFVLKEESENLKANGKEYKHIKPITQKLVETLLDVEQEVAYEEMANEGEVKLFNGLTLEGKRVDARTAKNPRTGEMIEVPSKISPRAKFGIPCKNALNK